MTAPIWELIRRLVWQRAQLRLRKDSAFSETERNHSNLSPVVGRV